MMPKNSTNENTFPKINIQFIDSIRELKIHVIHKTVRRFNLLLPGLKELVRYMQTDQGSITDSAVVHTKKYNIAVKLVFIRNRNKKMNIPFCFPQNATCLPAGL